MTAVSFELSEFYTPPAVDEAELAALPWQSTTAAVRAGDFPFQVRVSHPDLAVHLDRLLAGLPPALAGDALTTYSVLSGVGGHESWWAVYADGQLISNVDQPSAALSHLFAHLNRSVVEHSPADAVPLHAAACGWRGAAALIVGPSGSGKSTLAAGLGGRGLSYLTDEVAVVDRAELTVAPYAKPLTVKRGSWDVLAGLRPVVPAAIADVAATQWHVAPSLLAGGVATAPHPVQLLLRCRWQQGSATTLRPVSRAGMVVDLAMDMFRPRERVPAQLEVLARLARGALAYDLVYSDLEDASSAIVDLLERG